MENFNHNQSPQGLWNACDKMEMASIIKLHKDLSPFNRSVENCYEAGVQVTTLPGNRHNENDMILASLFLKRVLNDLRSTWLLLLMGYTSQAATIAASLFENALVINALAGNPNNVEKLQSRKDGDIPWTPKQLSKMMANQFREEAEIIEKTFTDKDYDHAWKETYSAYKFLCKIKHPTLRSSFHDAKSTSINNGKFVVMAAPNTQSDDLPLKAIVLLIAISRTYQAIRKFSLSLGCQTDHPYYYDFIDRVNDITSSALDAYKKVAIGPLPFNISDFSF